MRPNRPNRPVPPVPRAPPARQVTGDCPQGKVVFGGGYIAQLYNDAGFVGLGSASVGRCRSRTDTGT